LNKGEEGGGEKLPPHTHRELPVEEYHQKNEEVGKKQGQYKVFV
jgi:hypothetical protein